MNLSEGFDVVIMLTWSNWDAEPRSNRYHYASRFSKELPTFFFQHNYSNRHGINIRPSGINNLEIVDISVQMTVEDVNEIKQLLRNRGFLKPLLWIYDPLHYSHLISAFPNSYLVFHATEDYFTKTEYWNTSISGMVGSQLVALLSRVDYVVFVTTSLKKVYKELGGYTGPGAIIKNGCDANFYINLKKNIENSLDLRPSVIFQGGINGRIDYKLLYELITLMPDWDFKFCGAAQISEGWKQIIQLPNVQHFGALDPEEVGRNMYSSTVGIIPFVQDSWITNSLPLKAYEYVACGLPVVTVPILELEAENEIFTFAKSADEFEKKIRLLANSRQDVRLINIRCQSALENSYDERFELFKKNLLLSYGKKKDHALQRKSRIAVLYDPNSLHVSTIREHLESFERYSRNEIVYVPATLKYWAQSKNRITGFNNFDAVILHYSVRLSVKWHLDAKVFSALRLYNGLKLAFIQDEYEGTEITRSWLEEIHFDIVYTCVPNESIEKVYPKYRFPSTEFIQVLTGYASVNNHIESYAKPLSDRKIDIAYRGRNLPPIYGSLGHEKYKIGVDVKKLSESYGLNVDIELDSEKRIYGDAWYEFLGSARSTLGSESGSNIFDINGSIGLAIEALKRNNPSVSFEELYQEILINHEGYIKMNQISPKLFEAIQLRTALILFEGNYSNIILPDLHYIPLKKDYSNIDEVFEKLRDDSLIEKMTSQAYYDVITSGSYSYKEFIRGVDNDIASRLLHYVDKSKIFLAEFSMTRDKKIRPQTPLLPLGLSSSIQVNNMSIFQNLNLHIYLSESFNPLKIILKFLVRLILGGRDSNSFIFISAKKLWPYLPNRLQYFIINRVIN